MDILKKFRSSVSEATGIPAEIISDTPKLEITGRKMMCIENHKGIKSFTSTSVAVKTSSGIIYAEGQNITIKEINKEYILIKGLFASLRFEKLE